MVKAKKQIFECMEKKWIGLLIICMIVSYMMGIVNGRPIMTMDNGTDREVIQIDSEVLIEQELSFFHDDRRIEWIEIQLGNDIDNIAVFDYHYVMDGKSYEIPKSALEAKPDGWINIKWELDAVPAETIKLVITGNASEGFSLYLAEDLLGVGSCSVNDAEQQEVLRMRIGAVIKNKIWDSMLYPVLILLYFFGAIAMLLFCDKKSFGNGKLFAGTVLLNVLAINIVCPYTFRVPQLAENVLNFYYLTEKNSLFQGLFLTDAGYLPLFQRIIAIIGIKLLNLGPHSLYFMQIVGVVLVSCFAAAICLGCFRKISNTENRFVVALSIIALFAHPTVCTYFNFVYLGYFILVLLMVCQWEQMKKWQYIGMLIVSAVLCMSKGFYIVFFPWGIISFMLFSKRMELREKIYAITVTVAACMQVLMVLVNGGIQKWIQVEEQTTVSEAIGITEIILAVIAVAVLGAGMFFCIKLFRKLSSKIDVFWIHLLQLIILFIGSLLMPIIVCIQQERELSLEYMANWGNAWFIPASLVLGVLYLFAYEHTKDYLLQKRHKFILLIVQILVCVIGFRYFNLSLEASKDKHNINHNCAPWKVYAEHFDSNIVPVFKDCDRFGTLADDLTLWYSIRQPYDNYEYESPIRYQEIENSPQEEYITGIIIPDEIANSQITAIYVNYINDIGNQKIKLICKDRDGNIKETLSQCSPISTKTIGFICEESLKGIAQIEIVNENNEKSFVSSSYYFVTKK